MTLLSLAVSFLVLSPVFAADEAPEHEHLAALVRQLDLIDHLAEHAATVSPQDHTRYHFDYLRLREDVGRVRAGIRDYLVPLRAQPRDPLPLAGIDLPEVAGGVRDMADWGNKLYGQAFAAIYVPPGTKVAVHLEQPLNIDYDAQGRQVNHRIGEVHALDID
jgi:RAQPRD family integrative conjugative element protein